MLGTIVPKGGPWPNYVVLSDAHLMYEMGCNKSSVQSYFKELEEAGWLKRVRRSNVRKIYLLFEFLGAQSECMQFQDSGHAIPKNRKCTTRNPDMQFRVSGSQYFREERKKDSEQGTPSATSPEGGGSPTTSPGKPEQAASARPTEDAAVIEAFASSPDKVLRRLAEVAARNNQLAQLETRSKPEPKAERSPKSDLPPPTRADLLTVEEREEAQRVSEDPHSHELAAGIAIISLNQDRKAREAIERGESLPERGNGYPRAIRQDNTLGQPEDPHP
jgi:hypothetical protein